MVLLFFVGNQQERQGSLILFDTRIVVSVGFVPPKFRTSGRIDVESGDRAGGQHQGGPPEEGQARPYSGGRGPKKRYEGGYPFEVVFKGTKKRRTFQGFPYFKTQPCEQRSIFVVIYCKGITLGTTRYH